MRSFYKGTAKGQITVSGKRRENQRAARTRGGSPWVTEAILPFHISHPVSFTLDDGELQGKWSAPVEWPVLPYLPRRNRQSGETIAEIHPLRFTTEPHLHCSIGLPSHPSRGNGAMGRVADALNCHHTLNAHRQ